jgi:hypothetical protein
VHVCDVSVVLDTAKRVAMGIINGSDTQRRLRSLSAASSEVFQKGSIQVWRRQTITRFQIQERIDSLLSFHQFSKDLVMNLACVWGATAFVRGRQPIRLSGSNESPMRQILPQRRLGDRSQARSSVQGSDVFVQRSIQFIS